MTTESDSTELAAPPPRYGSFQADIGAMVIYDRKNPDAWISSTISWPSDETTLSGKAGDSV